MREKRTPHLTGHKPAGYSQVNNIHLYLP